MCWKKQTLYTSCRHSDIEEIVCDEEKKRQKRYPYPTMSTSQNRSYQPQQQRKQHHKSSWLILVCPCFSLFFTSPKKEECRLKPTLELLNGKCPQCLQVEADSAVFRGIDVDSPARPKDAVVASKRHGFIGDKYLYAERRSGSRDAYRATERERNPHQQYPIPPRGRRDGMDPIENDRGDAADGSGRKRAPLYVNARYQDAAQQERPRRKRQYIRFHDHRPQQTRRVPVNGDRDQDWDQGPSAFESGPWGTAYNQPGGPRGSTAHLIPRPLKISKTKKSQNMTRKAGVNGRSTARVRKSPPLGIALEERNNWRYQGNIVGSPDPRTASSDRTPELPLTGLIEEVEVLWQMAPNQPRQ